MRGLRHRAHRRKLQRRKRGSEFINSAVIALVCDKGRKPVNGAGDRAATRRVLGDPRKMSKELRKLTTPSPQEEFSVPLPHILDEMIKSSVYFTVRDLAHGPGEGGNQLKWMYAARAHNTISL